LISTQRGCVRRIVQSGVSLWRRLCSLMGALLDDDDDDDDDDALPVTQSAVPKR